MWKENLLCFLEQPINMQYHLFQSFVEISKLHYSQLMKEESEHKTGEKYTLGKSHSRWIYNP
jgi:hypothetical protein